MKPQALVLTLSLATALLAGCSKPTPPAAATASPPPAAEQTTAAAEDQPKFLDLQGKPVSLGSYAGKKVFVNYWASWCAPCIKEIPSIQRAEAALKNDNVAVLLASDESLETINNFLLDRGFSGNFVKLDGFVGAYGVEVMPTSILYDAKGMPVKAWQGAFEWDSAEMLAEIRAQ